MTIDEAGRNLPALLSSLLISILFIQSGLDKILDWKGNLGWLTGHFSKTFLSKMVPVMLATITLLELATGFLSAAGIVYFLATGSTLIMFLGSLFGALSLIGLFFGQRVAKDYPGAAVLIPYFLLTLLSIYLTSPYSRI